jgi:hypothetical protein
MPIQAGCTPVLSTAVGCTPSLAALGSAIGYYRVGFSAGSTLSICTVGRNVALAIPNVSTIGRGVGVALGGLAGYATLLIPAASTQKNSKDCCADQVHCEEIGEDDDSECEGCQCMRQNLIRNGQKILALSKTNRQIRELLEFQKELLDNKDFEIQQMTEEIDRHQETPVAVLGPFCSGYEVQTVTDSKIEDLSKKNKKLEDFVDFQKMLLDEKDNEIQRLMDEVESLREKGTQLVASHLLHNDRIFGA